MIVIATKYSHKIGYGHLFRSINLIKTIGRDKCLLLINSRKNISKYLKGIKTEIVNYDLTNWEDKYLKDNRITIWINDRLVTKESHKKKLEKNNIFSVFLDDKNINKDRLNIAQNIQIVKNIKNNVISRKNLLILKKVSDGKIFKRTSIKNIMITFGGSDTYNITNKVIKNLNINEFKGSIYLGPGYKSQIKNYSKSTFKIISDVKNLENQMYKYDLIICGGGITPFNAASQGLPSLIIACEKHEIETAKYLQKLDVSRFIGFRKAKFKNKLLQNLNIINMSKNCLKNFDNSGSSNFVKFIKKRYYEHKRD